MEITATDTCCSSSKLRQSKVKGKRKVKGNSHPDHSFQISRINRAIGQLEGVKRMIEARRYCPEIMIQTSAISSAVKSIERGILEKHLRYCVSEVLSPNRKKRADQKIKELIKVLKRF